MVGEPERQQADQSPGYRRSAGALVVVVGLALTLLLAATVLNTSPTQVAASQSLLDVPAFAGTQTTPGEFYAIDPAAAKDQVPGTVLRAEPIAEAPQGILAQRLLYVSQSADGANIVNSALYVTRAEPDPPPQGRPLVAVAHGTTGIAPGCGVSIAPFTPGSTGYATWDLIISGLVGSGFAVVATDYANLAVPATPNYLTLRGEGADVLNSMRAAYRLDRGTLDRGQAALLGHSQGGHAVLSAATIAPDYAPELSIKGTVAVAPAIFPPAPVLKDFLVAAPDKDAAGFLSFISNIVTSWSANFPGQLAPEDVFTEKGLAANALGNTNCQDVLYEAFKGPKRDFLKLDVPDSVLKLAQENFPVYERYTQPLLIQQGLEDSTVVPAVNIAAARTFCEQGSEVNLVTYPADVHSTVLFTGESDAVGWLRDRFAGVPMRSDCAGL